MRRVLLASLALACLTGHVEAAGFAIGHAGSFNTPLLQAPVNTVKPTISGTLAVAQTLTANNGNWIGAAPITHTYLWRHIDQSASLGTNQTYTVQAGDTGSSIVVDVTGHNPAGSTMDTSASVTIHGAAPPVAGSPVNTEIPQIIGLDYPVSPSTQLTFTADVGKWDNSPTSYAYNWHYVGGSSLGTGTTLTLDTNTAGVVGKALELDVTATNASGSSNPVTSHWFGPIETTPPPAPPEYEHQADPNDATQPISTIPLPTEPAHFLQNGHAIFPGCAIPPASPNPDPAHVWYFDPINGTTKDAGATGKTASPFKDISAIFNRVAGYTGGALFRTVIQPGDTIYIRPGDNAHPLGDLVATNAYSTSDGTSTGAIKWTWIMGDPEASSKPVLRTFSTINGAAGLVVRGLNFEIKQTIGGGRAPTVVTASGNWIYNVHDLAFEDLSISSWPGHSSDKWVTTHYPDTDGASNGKIDTANPTMSVYAPITQDSPRIVVTAPVRSNRLYVTGIGTTYVPIIGWYVWSPNYYYQGTDLFPWVSRPNSGIPNGTKVVDIQGRTDLRIKGIVSDTTGLPASGAANTDAYLVGASPSIDLYTWNKLTSVWDNEGAYYVTIADCDPVADHATGCPSTPPPGCDPVGNVSSGCPSTPPAWNGTTRALKGEPINQTDWMSISPAGYWNILDWNAVMSNGIVFAGGYRTNPIGNMPNDLSNVANSSKCLSAKDNTVRYTYNGMTALSTTNVIWYNNKVKYTTADDFDIYSDHRNWLIHNLGLDPTLMMAHPDGIQFGDSHGRAGDNYYSNAAIENEFYDFTDQTNLFPKTMQGINTTENQHWGFYACCNILVTHSPNRLNILGKYDVVVHNTVMGGIGQFNQPKSGPFTPTYSLLANNIGNGISRENQNPNPAIIKVPCATKGDTLEDNLSIPYVIGSSVSGSSSYFCTLDDNLDRAGAGAGVYRGLNVWNLTDYRSNQSGVSPLFMDYHPLDPVSPPPAPGGAISGNGADFSPCIHNTFQWIGDCAPGSSGIINLRPNPAFVPINPPAIAGSVRAARCLYVTRTTNPWYRWCYAKTVNAQSSDVYRTESADGSSPAGAYRFNGSVWTYIGPYNVKTGIIGKGTNLGAQQPFADIEGKAWANPPNIGAY